MGKTSDSSFLGKFFRSFQPSQEGLLPVITASLPLGQDRMEITGARWNLEGAEAVLQLRSLRASGDFDEYWAFHLRQEYQRNHADHYAGGKPPSPPNRCLGIVEEKCNSKDAEKEALAYTPSPALLWSSNEGRILRA
jgi:hypothetical protein